MRLFINIEIEIEQEQIIEEEHFYQGFVLSKLRT